MSTFLISSPRISTSFKLTLIKQKPSYPPTCSYTCGHTKTYYFNRFWKEKHCHEIYCTGIPWFITHHFIAPHRGCVFYKTKARSSTSKRITIALLRGPGSEPTVSLTWAYEYTIRYYTTKLSRASSFILWLPIGTISIDKS